MRTRTLRARATTAQDAVTTIALLAQYYALIVPRARRELRRWELRARCIPDPHLRTQAVATLREEMANAEAATVFATTAPRSYWPVLVQLLVAFQVMYDYLDTVGEEPVEDPLGNGLQLHQALIAALDPAEPLADWYRLHLCRDDGGYLDELVMTCRTCLALLPAAAAVRPIAKRAATRCGQGQSYTHAAAQDPACDLAAWSRRQDRATDYLWWEVAAGAISSVGVEALLAAAADPRTTHLDGVRIDDAYFPSMCALSTLLDSLVDFERDLATGNHNAYGLYPSRAQATERLATIAGYAATGVRDLRHSRRHAAILAGIAGYYLSAEGAESPDARAAATAIIDRLGPMVPMVLMTMRLRRQRRSDADDEPPGAGGRRLTRARRRDAAGGPPPSRSRCRRAGRRRRA